MNTMVEYILYLSSNRSQSVSYICSIDRIYSFIISDISKTNCQDFCVARLHKVHRGSIEVPK